MLKSTTAEYLSLTYVASQPFLSELREMSGQTLHKIISMWKNRGLKKIERMWDMFYLEASVIYLYTFFQL